MSILLGKDYNIVLSIIIVNYNTRDLLKGCLNSIIQGIHEIHYEIIVIDNASHDGSVEMLRLEFPQVRVIANTGNNGFAKANNQGIGIAQGRDLLFINPDTVVLDDAIEKMVEFINKNGAVGILGPKLYMNHNKDYHPSIRKFTSPYYVFLGFLPLAKYFKLVYNKYLLDKNRTRYVDWLCGAALVVKREVIEKIGLFDEDYFLYFEEEDYCFRAGRGGWRVCYFPAAQVIHYGGGSSQKIKPTANRYLWESQLRFFKKYYSSRSIGLFKACFIFLLKIKKIICFNRNDNEADQIITTVNNFSMTQHIRS